MLRDEFKDLLFELSDAGADFLVIGAYALTAHGIVRATGDMDIWVRPDAKNAELVHLALIKFGAPADHFTVADLAKPDMVLQMGQRPARIDILTSISGVEFAEAWEARVIADLWGVKVPVISLADLKANKRATARPQDLVDLEALERGGYEEI